MRPDPQIELTDHRPGVLGRRDFLRGVAGAGAAMALSSSLVPQAAAHKSGGLPQTITEAAKLIQTN